MKCYKRGDVVYVSLPDSTGSEQSGIRPCVIVQNDVGNVHSPTVIICPITSQSKPKLPTHVGIMLAVESTVLCEQIRVIDKRKIAGFVTNINMEKINRALKISIGLLED